MTHRWLPHFFSQSCTYPNVVFCRIFRNMLFDGNFLVQTLFSKQKVLFTLCLHVHTRLLPNRSLVAWGSQRIALGALIFHSNTFHVICWAPKFSAFSSEGPFKIFLGSSLDICILQCMTKLQDTVLGPLVIIIFYR